MHKIIQLISKKLYNKSMPLSMKIPIHWMNLMKNQIIKKIQSLEFFKERVTRQKTHLKNQLIKKIMFNGFKMSIFRCESHVHEIILPKNMFSCPLKFIMGFFGIFCIYGTKLKYSYTIMYECEKSPLTHELFYIGLFNFLI
jgi:hypothetical protein